MTDIQTPSLFRTGHLVVVGVDGSPGSLDALGAALSEARRRNASLRIVTAWQVPANLTSFGVAGIAFGELHTDAAAIAHRSSQLALEQLPVDPGVIVETCVVEGYPSAVLMAAARDADLLVVGRRGHSRLSDPDFAESYGNALVTAV